MKKIIYNFLYDNVPNLWFGLKYKIENEYQDYAYCKNDIAPFGDTRKKFMALAPVFNALVKNKSFLEIGCDTGFFPLYAAVHGARRSLGIDRNEHALSKARHAALVLNTNQTLFRHGVVPGLKLDETFDTVLFLSTIHYMFSDKEGNEMPFVTMEDFISYLSKFVGEFLLIEFVYPDDIYAQRLVADNLIASGAYGELTFIKSLSKHFTQVADLGLTHRDTRRLFLAARKKLPTIFTVLTS